MMAPQDKVIIIVSGGFKEEEEVRCSVGLLMLMSRNATTSW